MLVTVPIAYVLDVKFVIKVNYYNGGSEEFGGYADEMEALRDWRNTIYPKGIMEAWLYAEKDGKRALVRPIC